jgi:hypothetical protein
MFACAQVLREGFSLNNGMLLPGGQLHRRVVLRRHRHIIEDMYQKEGRSANGRPSTPPKKRSDGRRRGSPGQAMFGARNASGSDSDSRSDTNHHHGRDGDGGYARMRDRSDGSGHNAYQYNSSSSSPYSSGGRAVPGSIAGHLRQRQGITTSAMVGSTFSSLGRPFSLENGLEESQGGLDESLGNYFQQSSASNTPMASPRQSPRGRIGTPGASPRMSSLPNSPRENGSHMNSARGSGSRWSLPRSHDWQEKLSISNAAVGGLGSATKKDRGTYSPSSTVQTARPFDKSSNVAPGPLPPGTGGLMGLPLGGANFDGLVHICMPQIVASPGKPPRPSTSVASQSPRQQINSRSTLPRTGSDQASHTPRLARGFGVENQRPYGEKGGSDGDSHQTAPGEWAF